MARADIEFFQKLREHPPPEIASKDKHYQFVTSETEDDLGIEKLIQEDNQIVSFDNEINDISEEPIQDLSINEQEL